MLVKACNTFIDVIADGRKAMCRQCLAACALTFARHYVDVVEVRLAGSLAGVFFEGSIPPD